MSYTNVISDPLCCAGRYNIFFEVQGSRWDWWAKNLGVSSGGNLTRDKTKRKLKKEKCRDERNKRNAAKDSGGNTKNCW